MGYFALFRGDVLGCWIDLLYSLQDMEYDKEHGLFQSHRNMEKRRPFLYHAFFTHKRFLVLFALSADLGFMAYMGVFVAAVILWWEHRIVLKDFTKIDRAFFTLNGYLGIIFLFLFL